MSSVTSREQLREIVDGLYPAATAQSRAITTGQLWAFRSSIAVGDLVVMPLKTQPGMIALGRCTGAYRYDAPSHALQLVVAQDLRRITGYQDFVDQAPLDLVFVADHTRMSLVPVAQRESYASVAAGAIAQNVYLWCASAGLATVIRAWIDRQAIADALGLPHDHQVLLSQTVGLPSGT